MDVKRSEIRTDGETQMREALDNDTIKRYAEHMVDGDIFPPVVVFYDDEAYWLVDGFHRFEAHKVTGESVISAEVYNGSRIDAITYALKANDKNGKPRTKGDIARAYYVAVKNGLCKADDTAGVKETISCSGRWAQELTRPAREKAKAERDAEIKRLAEKGKSQREIAEATGVTHPTVGNIIGGKKRNSAEIYQTPTPPPAYEPEPADTGWDDEDMEDEPPEPAPIILPPPEADASPHHNHRAQGTGENEWYTPKKHIDAAREVLGVIELDPASSELANMTIGAHRFFTIEDDGLSQKWQGKVWMNPPYSQPHIKNFADKLVSEVTAGNVTEAIALTHNYTDTAWFHIMADACDAICFTRGRISFLNPEGIKAAPTQGQAFFYFGSNKSLFAEAFGAHGIVLHRGISV